MTNPCIRALVATLALCSTSLGALAQTPAWPSKPLRIIVGFPGGTSPDLTARALAEPLAKALGQAVVVENRPGAGGNIAADLVAKANDQHTIGLMINGNLTTARLLNPKLPYDPVKDLAPLSLIGTAPLVLAAPSAPSQPASAPNASPAEHAKAFVQTARQAGKAWSYGSPGVGTVSHIGMEWLKARTGIAPVHVPYAGNPQVVSAMLGGQVQLALLPPALALAQARAGKLQALAVTTAGRSTLAPELPSLAEAGLASFQLEIWNAAAAPASLPPAITARLSALISEIVRTPEMRQKLYAQGWQVVGTNAQGLALRMKADTAAMGEVIRSQGITLE